MYSERPSDAFATAQAILIDLDGNLLRGEHAVPALRALVSAAGERLIAVSNNSTHTAEELSAELGLLGLRIAPHRLVLAGATAVAQLAVARPGARVLPLATRSLCRLAHLHGLVLDYRDDEVEVVLVARDLDVDYARLQSAVRALRRGAEMLVANTDLIHVGEDGRPVPDTGVFVQALSALVPEARRRVVGKPETTLYQAALERLGAPVERAVVVCDGLDCPGAKSLGLRVLQMGALSVAEVLGRLAA